MEGWKDGRVDGWKGGWDGPVATERDRYRVLISVAAPVFHELVEWLGRRRMMDGWAKLDKFVIPIQTNLTENTLMVDQRIWRVLILCTGNSARSVVGEYLLGTRGEGRFEVESAGVEPTGRVNPLALWVLQDRYGIDASDARSQSTDEFMDREFDLVITVCDHARETCPVWPNKPVAAHWGSPDPAAVEGDVDRRKLAFVRVASQIAARVDLLCALPDEKIRASEVQAIGEHFGDPA